MLTKEFVKSLIDSKNKLKKPINDRILEIVEICKKHIKFGDWKPCFEDPNEIYFVFDEIRLDGNYSELIYIDCLPVYRFRDENDERDEIKANLVDKFGNHLQINGAIPTRWLWEDFEQELIDGILKYKNKDIDQLNNFINEKKNYELIKSKLTQKECDLLEIDKKISYLKDAIDRCS